MISDDFIIYLTFQMIVLLINLIGYSKIREMSFFAIIFELSISVQTILGFGAYFPFAVVLVIMNMSLPVYLLAGKRK